MTIQHTSSDRRCASGIRSVLRVVLTLCLAAAAIPAAAQIQPVDLGTLGGQESFAAAVNDRGEVVGSSQTADGSHHAFLWTAARGMVDLGTLGGAESFAVAVNASGRVVGDSDTIDSGRHVFSWTREEGMIDIDAPDESHAVGVTASGQVIGQAEFAGFSWTPAGGIVDLGSLSGGFTRPVAVNAAGQVVGVSTIASAVVGDPEPEDEHAFSWTAGGGMVDLGTLSGGFNSIARAVNASGQVVGIAEAGDGFHAFSWTAGGGMTDMGGLGEPSAINDRGQIVGSGPLDVEGRAGAFSWTAAGGRVELGSFFAKGSDPAAVNAAGQVIGNAYFDQPDGETTGIHGFSWTAAGGLLDLRPRGGSLSIASGVNATGLVAGSATGGRRDSAYHAVVWHVSARTLPPSDDAYVRAGAFATANFGRDRTVRVKQGHSAGNTRRSYLKFDVSDIRDSDRVTLRLHGSAPGAAGPATTIVYAVGDTSWDEHTVTWNTRPALGAVLGSLTVDGAVPQWVQLDVTRFVRSERQAGRDVITLALRSVDHTSAYAEFQSRESGNTGPRLVITR